MSDRIKVVCHGCGARYQVRASKVQGRRFRASCKKCGGIIVAHCSNAFTVLPESGSGSPRQSNPLQLERDDLYQEEEGWYVVISGKPHGPLSVEQVRQSFESGRIGERTYLWRAGDPEWRRLGEVPEFMDLSSGGQTAYYQGVQSTGETRAAGPAGLRRQGFEPGVEDPTAERTAFFRGEAPESSEQATRFHVRDPHAAVPVPAVPQEQPWEAVPVIPPRPAILPAPTGAARPSRRSSPDAGRAPPPSDFTRPLSDHERVEALGGGESDFRLLPSLAPAAPTGGPGDLPPLPPPKSVFSQSLKPIGPPAGPALLAPAEAPFWTTGKIAAAAAIGGGLAVAMAVVVVVSLVRPRPRPVMPPTPAARAAPPAKAAPSAPVGAGIPIKVRPEPEARAAPPAKAAPAEAAQAPARAAQAETATEAKAEASKAEAAKAEASKAEAKSRRPKAGSRARVTLRKAKPRRAARRTKKGVTSEVDALLAGARGAAPGAEKPEGKGVDPDALLAVGAGRKPKAAPDKPDPDALLAAAQKPSGLSQAQVRGAMRPVLPQVRACYDKYQVPGLVQVRFTVQPSGSSEARVVGKFTGTPTGFCVLNAARSASFPSFSGGARSFVYPFKLE